MIVKKIIKDNTFIDLKKDLYIDTIDGKQKVTKFYINRKTKIKELWIDDNKYIGGFTLNHKLLGKDKQWIYVNNLNVGDVLLDKEGKEHIITKIKEGEDYTFDIEVDKVHSYLLNCNIVSHNTVSQLIQTKEYGDIGSGIEPLFALKYKRFIIDSDSKSKKYIDYTTKLLDKIINDEELLILLKQYLLDNGTLKGISKNIEYENKEYLEEIENIFKTSLEIDYRNHIKMLESVQYCNSSSVSKTINLTKDATISDVENAYIMALESPYIKGITVYRDGSLQTQVLNTTNKKDEKDKNLMFSLKNIQLNNKGKIIPKERPLIMEVVKKKIEIQHSDENKIFYIELGVDVNNEPFELFIRPTTSTQEYAVLFNAIGRLTSLAFRSNVSIDEVMTQIKKVKDWKNEYSFICNAISDTIDELVYIIKKKGKRRIDEIKEINIQQKNWKLTSKGYYIDNEGNTHCPVCGNEVTIQEGCVTCQSCGWSACS